MAEHLKQQLLLRGVLKLLKVDTPVFVYTAAQVAQVNRGGGYGLEIPCEYEFEGDNFSCNGLKDKMQYEKYDIVD